MIFTEIEKRILKSVWNQKDPEQPKQSCERRTKVKSHTDFKLYYKAIAIKKQCTYTKIDTKINETDFRAHK